MNTMQELKTNYTDEKTGISYALSPKGYYLPDLTLPDEQAIRFGKYGILRRNYLKEHRKALFSMLLMSGKLNEHLAEIDLAANDRLRVITTQTAKATGVTEDLKARDQMLWVQRMNGIRNQAEEIIREELIYC
jgi:hypothetical protein